jgi:hypothetical protein
MVAAAVHVCRYSDSNTHFQHLLSFICVKFNFLSWIESVSMVYVIKTVSRNWKLIW